MSYHVNRDTEKQRQCWRQYCCRFRGQ